MYKSPRCSRFSEMQHPLFQCLELFLQLPATLSAEMPPPRWQSASRFLLSGGRHSVDSTSERRATRHLRFIFSSR